jgi:hypothetical protein
MSGISGCGVNKPSPYADFFCLRRRLGVIKWTRALHYDSRTVAEWFSEPSEAKDQRGDDHGNQHTGGKASNACFGTSVNTAVPNIIVAER